mmetsp:Transcript_5825/g.8154  ORF Transcript_5825/g.8154 Transcript_5825/m.8154 type:complete len:157 (-) Transcript_5825:92-562(-)
MATAAVPLRDISNQVESKIQPAEKKPVKWNGTHLKFDEDGQAEAIIKEVLDEVPLADDEIPNPEEEQLQLQSDQDESAEVPETDQARWEKDDEEDEENANDAWAYRDSKPLPKWEGTHVVFPESDDDTAEYVDQVEDAILEDINTALSASATISQQ